MSEQDMSQHDKDRAAAALRQAQQAKNEVEAKRKANKLEAQSVVLRTGGGLIDG